MNGTLGNLSDKQQDKLNKFKANIKDVLEDHHDDHLLLRFLRARNFDLKTSESLFRKDVKWKKEVQASSLSSDNDPEVLKKYWPGGTIGFDKDGCPVWIDPVGRSDMKGLLSSAKTSDIIKHNIIIVESLYKLMEEQSLKLGRHIEGTIYIADFEEFGLHHLWKPGVDIFNKNAAVFEQHYPETLKKILIINAPKYFPLVFSLIKPFLQEYTRKKVNVLGSNWKEILLRYIDPDNLPVYWGGTAVGPDGDPKCTHKIVMGGKVPESFLIKGRNVSSKGLVSYDLARGSNLTLSYTVTKPDSILRYEFKTKHHDIAFTIRRIGEDGSKEDIMSKQRYNCHLVPEDGEINLAEPGTYIVKFDNAYSWTKPKMLKYWVELLEPAGENGDDAEPEFSETFTEDLLDLSLDD